MSWPSMLQTRLQKRITLHCWQRHMSRKTTGLFPPSENAAFTIVRRVSWLMFFPQGSLSAHLLHPEWRLSYHFWGDGCTQSKEGVLDAHLSFYCFLCFGWVVFKIVFQTFSSVDFRKIFFILGQRESAGELCGPSRTLWIQLVFKHFPPNSFFWVQKSAILVQMG